MMQSQYASRHLTGLADDLGQGLRVDLSGYAHGGDYHSISIHRDDAAEFAGRLRAHWHPRGLKI
jgi:hypothetical protein